MFKRILIANRGEIACRVMKTCREMGIESISIYTEGEEDLPHATMGDININLGSGPLAQTYLNIENLISIAKKYNAEAVHPGYGFLSENADFAKALTEAKIKLIGPPAEAMVIMGDKISSKEKIEKLKVPSIPGYHGNNQEADFLKQQASEIGYPVLVKASAGGGGKGMRIVQQASEFDEALASAKREAMNAFGNDKVLIEKFIVNPRHIEVQVLSDQKGNHLHLFERECSIQRRYQKIVEETPSPAFSEKTRQDICNAAVEIAKGVDYEGAGTVEFIYDEDGRFYFLEMNTRLQVEHPITEMVTGVDLVRAQIMVAAGLELPFAQKDITQRGHALEVRYYAENPDNNFLPSTGKISYVGEPRLNNVRLDTGYRDGNQISIDFDPMLAKLITWGQNRAEAIEKMKHSFDDIPFLGPVNNIEYLKRILDHKEFIAGNTFTHFVSTHEESLKEKESALEEKALALAAHLLADNTQSQMTSTTTNNTLWSELKGFKN